ncbi:carbohydrate ABC transporter permease [Anaerocolumna xylanovorans]|uniref:Raffinose/stachyose/melibiose transport system permease protein n=1 Tax=Anaerocolumna xylanovorans DSM 12503 TaxID=1121345 RepID=A0A1M7YFW8_9FIRM|nr:carbohydrate ABC transporter permease [Anaerocolumna xylanovorans]SHO51503.1 raffinose/stachyose/melibiose transport system permease protein [Anaerocolumna xylanovorans DSM 12503]
MLRKKSIFDVMIYLLLALVAVFWLFPLIMAFVNSFKTNGELLTNVLSMPKTIDLKNYIRTIEKMHYIRSFGNTVLLSSLSVVLIILFSALAGWKLCRTKTKLSSAIFSLFVFSMLIPFSSIMIPLYRVVLAFHIKNSLVGLSFVYAGLGVSMAIFLYHGFVKGIPIDLEEAAAIDGCNNIKTFSRIVFPMLKPITATICITNVLWVWNDFLLPLINISDNKKYTLLLSTNTLFGQYSSDWSAILSALILAAIPVIIFYAIFQKQILKGIAEGAVKG